MTFTETKQTPLETLMISQLASIRKGEAELQARLHSGASLETAKVAAEIWKLQTSADRLNRMIDAMGVHGSHSAFSFGSKAAA